MNKMHERSIDQAMDQLLDAIGLERVLDLLDGRTQWDARCATPLRQRRQRSAIAHRRNRR